MENKNTDTNYYKIGIFVLIGISLIVSTLLIFGSNKLFQRTVYIETYFDESVQGISEGTAVKYRGLQIGYVKDIGFTSDIYNTQEELDAEIHNRSIYVKVAITSKLFTQLSNVQLREMLEKAIEEGLRFKIMPQGLTGIAYLELNFMDPGNNLPLKFPWKSKYVYVPSAPSMMTQVGENLQYVLHHLKDINFKDLFKNIEELTLSSNYITKKIDDFLDKINNPAESTVYNLKIISDNLKALSEQVKLYPSQMILSKPPAKLDPRKL